MAAMITAKSHLLRVWLILKAELAFVEPNHQAAACHDGPGGAVAQATVRRRRAHCRRPLCGHACSWILCEHCFISRSLRLSVCMSVSDSLMLSWRWHALPVGVGRASWLWRHFVVKPLRDTKDGGPISRAPMSDALCNQLVTYTLSHTVAPAPTPGQNCLGPRGGVSLHLPSLTVAQIGLVFRL